MLIKQVPGISHTGFHYDFGHGLVLGVKGIETQVDGKGLSVLVKDAVMIVIRPPGLGQKAPCSFRVEAVRNNQGVRGDESTCRQAPFSTI